MTTVRWFSKDNPPNKTGMTREMIRGRTLSGYQFGNLEFVVGAIMLTTNSLERGPAVNAAQSFAPSEKKSTGHGNS